MTTREEAFEFLPYEAADGWRWRMVAENGKIMSGSSEAYTTRQHVEDAIGTLEAHLFSKMIKAGTFKVIRAEHWQEIKKRMTEGNVPAALVELIEASFL